MTNPAAETKVIGLLALAQLSWFLHRRLDSFIVTGQLLLVYRDIATLTVSPGRETSRPFTGTLQKLMPTLTQTATPHTTGPL
jgi:ABC-type xylose transport system permease subunit